LEKPKPESSEFWVSLPKLMEPAQPCRSPKTYRKLKPGRHTFKVWATAGILTDPTPAKFSWKILPKR